MAVSADSPRTSNEPVTSDKLAIALLRLDEELAIPSPRRPGDAAIDLPARHDVVIAAGQRELVPTGFAVAIPERWCGLILPRSGLALNNGLTVLNGPGLIDSGYRGELQVILHNTGTESVEIFRGDRIAQLLIQAVPESEFHLVSELPAAIDDRGEQGFGSSGRIS